MNRASVSLTSIPSLSLTLVLSLSLALSLSLSLHLDRFVPLILSLSLSLIVLCFLHCLLSLSLSVCLCLSLSLAPCQERCLVTLSLHVDAEPVVAIKAQIDPQAYRDDKGKFGVSLPKTMFGSL